MTNQNNERAKDIEHAIEKINEIEELETKKIIEYTKTKLYAIENGKMIKINEPEEDLRTETVREEWSKNQWVLKWKIKKQ